LQVGLGVCQTPFIQASWGELLVGKLEARLRWLCCGPSPRVGTQSEQQHGSACFETIARLLPKGLGTGMLANNAGNKTIDCWRFGFIRTCVELTSQYAYPKLWTTNSG